MKNYKNIYFDEKNHRFSLFIDERNRINFSYWYEFKRHDIRYIEPNSCFQADLVERKLYLNSRGQSIENIKVGTNDNNISYRALINEVVSSSVLSELFAEQSSLPIVLINCDIADIEFDQLTINREVALIDCCFKGNFRLVKCDIKGSLWLSNSRFEKHFSLKSTNIEGNVHLEGADFSGLGGVSFRGLRAKNLYLDLGVNGSDDMIWLNEMLIDGVVSIGGVFQAEIQLLGLQDHDTSLDYQPRIGDLVIGKELYEYENANKCYVAGDLRIEGLWVSGCVAVDNLEVSTVSIKELVCRGLKFNYLSTNKDFIVEDCNVGNQSYSVNTELVGKEITVLSLVNSSVSRHCKIDRNTIVGLVDLENTAVGEVTYFENNKLEDNSQLNILRFTTSKFLVYPVNILYGAAKSRIFSPKKFALLKDNHDRALGDQYCALKHWLADAGRLEMEDVAYFHMRDCHHSNKLTQLVLGGVFGWGVRLSNVVLSSIVFIFCFALIYLAAEPDMVFSSAVALSVQAFICSFFGVWKDYAPESLMASLVTLESFFGVVFVTVFIGAYIRKLLR